MNSRISRILMSICMFTYDAMWVVLLFMYMIPLAEDYSKWGTMWFDPEIPVILFFSIGSFLTVYTFVWGFFLLLDR